MNSVFNMLDPIIQKWIYSQGWEDLREIQKLSIPHVLEQNCDMVISASTAAGKTEAAFLPALTKIKDVRGFGILYVSPLKSLINDQFRRLEPLCEKLNIPITSWHGDSNQSKKNRVITNPSGVVLITPESLESLLIRKPGWVYNSFINTQYIIIDEYHAFLGSERGTQLHSLLHRIESLLDLKKIIPRIALSATLGEMEKVVKSLRPKSDYPCKLIVSNKNKSSLNMIIKGYINSVDDKSDSSERQIAKEMYKILRGDSNLIFANSRQRTEKFSVLLKDLCEENLVPNEFFPHHGSLSKEIRTELESRLQKESLPTTAVCTMTLELGIDIGKVTSIAQVTAPFTVTSLRQRIGRSGRRGDPAILRMFITENELSTNSSVVDKLRLELLQSIAMVKLLILDKWYEPTDLKLCHFSTLLHQILAVTSQWGGVRADQLWNLLCESGTFNNVNIEQFKTLLQHMGEKELIKQLDSGELILDVKGERIVEHYTFYGVFKLPEEYRIMYEGKTIGSVPIDSFLVVKQHIVFSGKRWEVTNVDVNKKVIHVTPAEGGNPPNFCGYGMSVDNLVRREMLKVYMEEDYKLDLLDDVAKDLFLEGLKLFNDLGLRNTRVISHGKHVIIIPWMGDKIINTLVVLLINDGYKVSSFSGVIELENANKDEIIKVLESFTNKTYLDSELSKLIPNKIIEKYDNLLPNSILNVEYAAKSFDIKKTLEWIQNEVT